MKKLLYLTTWDFSDGASTGITNKIKSQIKALEESGFMVDYTYIFDNAVYFNKAGCSTFLGKVGKLRKLAANYYLYQALRAMNYEYVYNRYGLMDTYYYKLLKMLKNEGSKIVVEIPTYPYDKERLPGLRWWILYSLDKIYRKKLNKYVNRIATCSEDNQIFGIKTIHIHNGIDIESVTIRKAKKSIDGIHMIAVAGLAKWHGYDRLLKGMGEYYQSDGKMEVYFHIVGDGPVREEYERIVEEYQLQKHVIFEGVKKGKELDKIYDMCEIGIECLAAFRKDVHISSSLKSREYAAKGIPFITASKSDVFDGQDFVLKVPENESSIDIHSIISFYNDVYKGKERQKVAELIRSQAQQCCDCRITMKPIIEYMQDKVE